jgi:hypothetical protein
MNELQWVKTVQELIGKFFVAQHPHLEVIQSASLPYANEVLEYKGATPKALKPITYETDLLIIERTTTEVWKPRIVIEGKVESVTTHDAITYSEKAFAHKRVHPYLRYGILLGHRKHYPLPGRLFRHGLYFDFMASWVAYEPTPTELKDLLDMLLDEVEASRNLEEMLYQSRSYNRKQYVVLHKPLRLKVASKAIADYEDGNA